jgi:glycosyltransferase involved in cell wall biosynthesis
MPEVSVIIPAYNSARFLAESIPTVLQQTFADFELLVVDDGSTDDTRQVVASFECDARVRYVHQQNRGGAAARNTGIAHCTGKYIAFLDADDLWAPEKLQKQVAVFQESTQVEAVHTAAYLVQLDGEQREVSRRILRRPAFLEQTLYEELLYRMVIIGSASSVMVRRPVLQQVGPFHEQTLASDRDMWQRIAEHYDFHYVDEPLVCIRKHQSNMSNDWEKIAESQIRYFHKLTREIPPQYRFHLPRVALSRFALLAIKLVWLGHFRVTCTVGWICLRIAFRHPFALYHAISRLLRTHILS